MHTSVPVPTIVPGVQLYESRPGFCGAVPCMLRIQSLFPAVSLFGVLWPHCIPAFHPSTLGQFCARGALFQTSAQQLKPYIPPRQIDRHLRPPRSVHGLARATKKLKPYFSGRNNHLGFTNRSEMSMQASGRAVSPFLPGSGVSN